MTSAELRAAYAALPDRMDRPGNLTPREVEADEHRRAVLLARISDVGRAEETLATVLPGIATLEGFAALQEKWLRQLTTELLDDPALQRPSNLKTQGKAMNLKLSLACLHRGKRAIADSGFCLETLRLGQLMRDDGYTEGPRVENQMIGELPWPGSMPEIEESLKFLRAQRDDAQQRLAIDAAQYESVPV